MGVARGRLCSVGATGRYVRCSTVLRLNVLIALAVAAVTVSVWLVAVREDTGSTRERGARAYCETLLEHGVLMEPMARCLREYREGSR